MARPASPLAAPKIMSQDCRCKAIHSTDCTLLPFHSPPCLKILLLRHRGAGGKDETRMYATK
jgi:hypothetical protein